MRLFVGALLAAALLAWPASSAPAPPRYHLDAALDPAAGRVAVHASIDIPAEEAAEGASFLLGRTYVVSGASASPGASVTVATIDAPFPSQRIFVKASGRPHRPARVQLDYAGPLTSLGAPVNAVAPDRIELSADSLWYPLSEKLGRPLLYDARVHGLPGRWIVASPDQVALRAGGFELHRRRPSPDIAFVAAPDLREVPLGRLSLYAADPQAPLAKSYAEVGPQALAFLEKWLGPLPNGKAVIAVVRRKSGVGYSRPGYIVVADTGLEAPDVGVWARWGYIAHELSHNWWSNADFLSEDYWLVESTAEYCALRFIEDRLGPTAIEPLLENKRARARRAGPILGHGRPSDDAVYAKGPLLLIDLEHEIGRPKLDALLASLARRPQITTTDFLEALSRTASPATAAAFRNRLSQ
jgi:hypothetical protein